MLDPNDLVQLRERAEEYVEAMRAASQSGTDAKRFRRPMPR